MTDSIHIETIGSKVKSIKIYAKNEEYDSSNEFFMVTSKTNENELTVDLNAKMNIIGKAKQGNDHTTNEWIIEDVIAKDTNKGYSLILKRIKVK